MRIKPSRSFIIFFVFAAVIAVPVLIFAQSSSTTGTVNVQTTSRIEKFREELKSYLSELDALKLKPQTVSTKLRIKQLEEEVNYVNSKIKELEGRGQEITTFTKNLSRGSSGEDVKKLQETLKKEEVYPEGLVTGHFGPLTEAAVKRFQEKHGIESTGTVGPITRKKLNEPADASVETSRSTPSPEKPAELPKPLKEVVVKKALQRGHAGEDVQKVQGFLKDFPEIYPNGLATGFYGEQTEKAVKKFQEKVGIKQTGEVDEKTKEVLNLLLVAGEKKKPPKITDVTPSEGSAGITVTLSGKGFTLEDNSIMVRGKIMATGIKSYDNNTQIDFILTSDIPCSTTSNKACPIKVVNANGISNAKPFKLTEFFLTPPDIDPKNPPKKIPPPDVIPPDVPPPPDREHGPPSPPPPPPPPPAPMITTISPIKGSVWTQIILTGSGFTSTGNSVNFAGVSAAVTNLSSSDGKTLIFSIPGTTPCKVGETCAVSVTNINGTSNEVSFLLTQRITPVKVVFPNGGENLVQGVDFTLSWTGGTDRVDIVLVEEGALPGADPGAFIAGWIATSTKPNGTVVWNAKTVCSADGAVCTPVVPGQYKLMALSEDELGLMTIWDDFTNLSGNWDLSDRAFTISPSATLTVVVPNGGEIGSQRSAFIICWGSIDLKSKAVKIELLKNGAFYRTIYPSYQQSSETGAFITNWIIPTDIPEGMDYQVKISDVNLPSISDSSDKPFSITAASSSIWVHNPTYGRIWYGGFSEYVGWYSTNIQSKTVNINLWKGGFFYRSIAQNVLQGYDYYGTGDTTGWFYRYLSVPKDLPAGQDYTVEVADAANPSVRGFSPPFAVVQYPTYLTVKGRLADYVNKTPLANTYVQTWDGSSWYSGFATTNLNGEFSLTTKTADILLARGHSFWTYPQNYDYKHFFIQSNSSGLYAYIPVFPFIGKDIVLPVTSGEVNLGEIPFWPFVDWTSIVSDVETRSTLNYRHPETGQSTYGWGYYWFTNVRHLWKWLPQGTDAWARLEDKPGNIYDSPMLNLPTAPAVPSKGLSLFNQVIKWEPYAIDAYAYSYPQLLKVGNSVSGWAYAWGGVAPYIWSILSGSLPPGVTLSSSGSISGAPTKAGVYEAILRVQDVNKVNGITYWPLKFNVLTTTGTEVPTIKVLIPQARVELSPGSATGISWQSYGITGQSVNIELLKAGSVVRKLATFQQGTVSGYFYSQWIVPTDLDPGTDYAIRVSDASNAAVYSVSDLFIITSRSASIYLSNWNDKYNPYIYFNHATSTNSDAKTFKLYEKKPGDTAAAVIATFSDPKCNQSLASGSWYLSIWCQSWYPIPSWSLHQWPWRSASEFLRGDYSYEVRSVDGVGKETSIANVRFSVKEPVTVVSPVSTDSPLTSATPTFRWTIPKDWPTTLDKQYTVYVSDASTGGYLHNMWGVSAPTDTTGFRKYDGPALDPTKKYNISVSYLRNHVLDPATVTYTSYVAMSATSTTFWIGP